VLGGMIIKNLSLEQCWE